MPVRAHGDEPRVKHGAYPRGAAALGEPFDHRVEQPLRLGEVEPGADVPAKRRDAVLGVDPVVGHAHVVLVPHRHLPQPHETQLGLPRAFLLEVAAGGRDSNFVSFAHRLQFLVDRGPLRRERGLRVDPRGFRERPGELRLFPPGLRGRHSLRADGFSLGGDLAGLARSSPVRFGFLRERREFPLDVFAIGARVLLGGVQLCLQHHARGLSLGFERLSLLCPRGSLLLEPSSRVFFESREGSF